MNDLLQEKAICWNTRLRKCLDEKGYTQVVLAEKINEKYRAKYNQKDVSRWLNIGTKTKNGEIGFPKYHTMLLIADFFDVDVGYLTGETDEYSFTLEKACTYTGLNGEAIKAIRKITHPHNKSSYMWKERRESFNKLLTADRFAHFFKSLEELYRTYTITLDRIKNTVFDNLDSAIGFSYDSENSWKFLRYEMNEALILLMDEIYPKPSLTDVTIKEEQK